MLYKNLKTFNHSKCVKTFPIILKCGLFIIYKSIIREFKSKPYAVTVSSFPLKHWGRASKNWGRISFQLWLLHAHCITLTAKCWMNNSYRFCIPSFFLFLLYPLLCLCTVNSLLPCVSSDNELKFPCGALGVEFCSSARFLSLRETPAHYGFIKRKKKKQKTKQDNNNIKNKNT